MLASLQCRAITLPKRLRASLRKMLIGVSIQILEQLLLFAAGLQPISVLALDTMKKAHSGETSVMVLPPWTSPWLMTAHHCR
ncbi:MAG: hypothetical protein CL931_00120 [Deltaproteobacteria bacterium]|nr:hypothetical protein [Deltaproteobacteria bacterium]